MVDMNSLNKLTDEIPEDMKEKLKKAAMEKLGLSNPEAATPCAQEDQAQPNSTSDVQVNNSEQSESTDEDKSDAA